MQSHFVNRLVDQVLEIPLDPLEPALCLCLDFFSLSSNHQEVFCPVRFVLFEQLLELHMLQFEAHKVLSFVAGEESFRVRFILNIPFHDQSYLAKGLVHHCHLGVDLRLDQSQGFDFALRIGVRLFRDTHGFLQDFLCKLSLRVAGPRAGARLLRLDHLSILRD